jgi:hypothetical protein
LGVIFAGLALALVLPLLAGAGKSSAFPRFVMCQVQSQGAVCRTVKGGVPGGEDRYDGGAVYELHGEMRSGRTNVTSPYKVGYGSEAPPRYPFLACARSSGSTLRCLVVSNATHILIQEAGSLGLYVIVQPQT